MDNPEQLGEGAVQGGNAAGTVSSDRKQTNGMWGAGIEMMLLPLNIVEREYVCVPHVVLQTRGSLVK